MANLLNRLDEWVIDRVAQPVADRLAHWKSADEIGRSCLIGSSVFVLGGAVLRWQQGTLTTILALSGAAVVACNIYWLRTIPPPSENSLPIARTAMFLIRPAMLLLWLVFQPLIVVLSLIQTSMGDVGFDQVTVLRIVESTLTVAAMYLMACKTRPPSRQERAAWWAKAGA